MATIRVRYEKGVLTPLEPLDLEEGKVVVVSVQDAPTPGGEEQTKSSASPDDPPVRSRGLLGIVERAKELQKSMPPEELDGVRTDGAKNYKHYLYGHPKVED